MDTIEVTKAEYAELSKRPTTEAFDAEKARADEAESKLKDAEKAAEDAEAAKAKAETEKAEAESKLTEAEEKAAAANLKQDRLSKLGSAFTAKLGDKTKTRLHEQAGTMSDEEWTARLDELAEAYGVKADEGKPAGEPGEAASDGETVFSREQVENAGGNGGLAPSEETAAAKPSSASQSSVIGGLFGLARSGKL